MALAIAQCILVSQWMRQARSGAVMNPISRDEELAKLRNALNYIRSHIGGTLFYDVIDNALLPRSKEETKVTCLQCHAIQKADPSRHFKGCDQRIEKGDDAAASKMKLRKTDYQGPTCCEIVDGRPCSKDAGYYHPQTNDTFCAEHGEANPALKLGLAPYDAQGHADTCDRLKPFQLPSYVYMPIKLRRGNWRNFSKQQKLRLSRNVRLSKQKVGVSSFRSK
jgi:hypothetical protein